jgi:PAS domain S-box-containing protein
VSAIALACFTSAKLAFLLMNLGVTAAPVWCPSGIALAVLLLYGRNLWTGVALGIFVYGLSLEMPWMAAAGAATGSTLEAIVGHWLLHRLRFRPALRTVRDVLGFMSLAVILAPIVNASFTSLAIAIAGWEPWDRVGICWGKVWLGDSMGVLVFTPLLLSWLGRPLPPWTPFSALAFQGQHLSFRQRLVEVSGWVVLLLGVSWTVFQSTRQTAIAYYPLEYLPFPIIVWAALRLGQRGTVLGSFVVSAIALWGVVERSGPFLAKSNGNLEQAVLLLQTFICVITTMALVLAAAVAERQQAEDLLRKRETSLLNAQRIAQLGNWDLDLPPPAGDGSLAIDSLSPHWSDELYRILGRAPGTVVPSLEAFWQAVHPADRSQLRSAFERAVTDRVPYHHTYRILHPDGTERLVSEQVEISALGITGTVQDITAQQQAETALRESEAQFRVVAETAACAFLVYQGSRLRYVNSAAERITEYSRQELLEIDFWELAHPDFRAIVRQRGLGRQRGEVVPSRYDLKILTKSGQERWLDFTAGVVELKGQTTGLATAYDITDRKAAEAQLRQAANRDRLLTEIALRIRQSLNLDEILNTTVAEVRQFLQADRVFISCFAPCGGCRAVAESVDPQWASLLHQALDPAAVQEARSLFERDGLRVIHDTEQVEKTPWLADYYDRAQVRAGIGVPLSLEGEIFGVLTVNQCSAPRQWQPFEVNLLQQLATQVEIAIQQGQLYQQVQELAANLETQVEDRTAELHQRMQELQHLNQVKDLLLHAVAHDLRTPMQGMVMVLNKLRSKCTDPCHEQISINRSMLDCMIRSSDHQLQLLTSLLADHTPPEPSPRSAVTLYPVVQSVLTALEPLLQTNSTIVQNHIPADLPAAWADAAQLHQLFTDLIANAVQHNAPGLTIALRARVNPQNWLYCAIIDNGMGITPAQRDRLFQLYVRGLDNPHRTGIGLGLHRCHQIVTAHGGQIGISELDEPGAGFWFTLPIEPAPSLLADPAAPHPHLSGVEVERNP